MGIYVEFTNQENINRKKQYIIPWHQINLESNKPIKAFKLDDDKDMVCSEGKIVIFDKRSDKGDFEFAPFNTDSFDSLTLVNPFDNQVSSPRAISNDGKLAVGIFQERYTQRTNLQSHGAQDQRQCFQFIYKTMLKVFNRDKKGVCKNDLFDGERLDVKHVKISPNNNFVAVIYLTDDSSFECKMFKFTDEGWCKYLYKFSYEYDMISSFGIAVAFDTMFNSREDLYMIRIMNYESSGIFVYDIIKQNLIEVPEVHDSSFDQSFLICTPNQDLVYIYDKSNLLLCYNLSDDSAIEPITVLDFVKDFGIVVFDDTIMVHYFTKVRVYVSTGVELCVLCPFKKTILQTFKIDIEFELIEEQKIIVNWSGEEIFFCCADGFSVKNDVFAFFFYEDKKKQLKLTTLARRAVLSFYPLVYLRKLNLPSSVKELLGIA
eukprot:TCONS_00022865-protein